MGCLRCDASSADSFVYRGITFPGSGDWWYQVDVFIPSATLNAIIAAQAALNNAYTADFLGIQDAVALTNGGYGNIVDASLLGDAAGDAAGLTSPATFTTFQDPGFHSNAWTADAWHTVKIHWDSVGGLLHWYIDGVAIVATTPAVTPPAAIHLGGFLSTHSSGEVYWFDNVKVGTTDGGSDIFSDDFESGLGAWNVVGPGVSTATCPGTPPFRLAASPASVTTCPGGSVTSTVTSTLLTGSPETINLTATGQPAGVTVSFAPASISDDGGSSVVTFAVGGGVALGTYTVTVKGDDGAGGVNTVPITLVVAATDFSLSASPNPISFGSHSPFTQTSVITVSEIACSETVTLSIGTVPAGLSASLAPLSVVTPGTAMLNVTITPGTPCGTYTIPIDGTDGTNSHTLNVTVSVTGTTFTYDTRPTVASQAGATFRQHGDIRFSQLCELSGQLYVAWTEQGSPSGPYLAVWTGAAWNLVGGPIETVGIDCADIRLVTDGTNLFIVYAAQFDVTQPDCRSATPGTTVLMSPFFARVWKYDGATFTDLGALGLGQRWVAPPSVLLGGPPFALTNNVQTQGDDFVDGGFSMRVSASPDQVGACYVAFYEEGFQGPTIDYWWWRRYTVAGFGTDLLLHDFTPSLAQPPHPTGLGGICSAAPCGPGSSEIQFDIAGGGVNLALYTEPLDLYDPVGCTYGAVTKMRVWQPGGFQPDIDLATEFPLLPGYAFSSPHPYALHLLSNETGTIRYVTVTADHSGTRSYITKSSLVAAPSTLTDLFGDSCDAFLGGGGDYDWLAERHNLFAVEHLTVGGAAGDVVQRTDKCPPCESIGGRTFIDATGPGAVNHLGYGTIFDDALWMPGFDNSVNHSACVYKLPICRDCGTCCVLLGGANISHRVHHHV